MSPEQASGKQELVGPASDIYSLGAILYACLTGRAPFVADSPVDTLLQVMKKEPVSPRELNPSVPKDLETICLKCLAKEPHKRYGTAQELANDLGRFLEGRPVTARPVSASAKIWRWARRNPRVASLTALSVLLLVSGIAASSFFAIEADHRAGAEADQRRRADHQAELAIIAQQQTEQALSKEEFARSEAETARHEAETQRAAAMREKSLAQQAQHRAEQAQQLESQQRKIAEEAKKLAQWQTYVARLYPLMDRWHQKDYGQLDRMLDESIPGEDEPDFRGWEWYYLRDQTRQFFHPLPLDRSPAPYHSISPSNFATGHSLSRSNRDLGCHGQRTPQDATGRRLA